MPICWEIIFSGLYLPAGVIEIAWNSNSRQGVSYLQFSRILSGITCNVRSTRHMGLPHCPRTENTSCGQTTSENAVLVLICLFVSDFLLNFSKVILFAAPVYFWLYIIVRIAASFKGATNGVEWWCMGRPFLLFNSQTRAFSFTAWYVYIWYKFWKFMQFYPLCYLLLYILFIVFLALLYFFLF